MLLRDVPDAISNSRFPLGPMGLAVFCCHQAQLGDAVGCSRNSHSPSPSVAVRNAKKRRTKGFARGASSFRKAPSGRSAEVKPQLESRCLTIFPRIGARGVPAACAVPVNDLGSAEGKG